MCIVTQPAPVSRDVVKRGRDVVDERRPLPRPPSPWRRAAVDADAPVTSQLGHDRQDAALPSTSSIGSAPGRGLAADIDDVGASAKSRRPWAIAAGWVEIAPTVGERVWGDVEHPHHDCAIASSSVQRGFRTYLVRHGSLALRSECER